MIASIIAFFSALPLHYWVAIVLGIAFSQIITKFFDDVGTIAENSKKMAKDKNKDKEPPQLPKN